MNSKEITNDFLASTVFISKANCIEEIIDDAYNCKGQTTALTCLLAMQVYKTTTNISRNENPVAQFNLKKHNRPSKIFQKNRFQKNRFSNKLTLGMKIYDKNDNSQWEITTISGNRYTINFCLGNGGAPRNSTKVINKRTIEQKYNISPRNGNAGPRYNTGNTESGEAVPNNSSQNKLFNISYLDGDDITKLNENMLTHGCSFNNPTIAFDIRYNILLLDKNNNREDFTHPIDCFYAQRSMPISYENNSNENNSNENILFISIRGTQATSGWEWISNANTTQHDWFNQHDVLDDLKIKVCTGFFNALIALICPGSVPMVNNTTFNYEHQKRILEKYFEIKQKIKNGEFNKQIQNSFIRQFSKHLDIFKGGLIDVIENGIDYDSEYTLFSEKPVNKKIIITGHSRGAIVAHLMTFFINYFYPDIQVITYSYASPRGLNLSGVAHYLIKQAETNSRSFRFANEFDSVPQVPGHSVETWSILPKAQNLVSKTQRRIRGLFSMFTSSTPNTLIDLEYYHPCPGIRFKSLEKNTLLIREWPTEYFNVVNKNTSRSKNIEKILKATHNIFQSPIKFIHTYKYNYINFEEQMIPPGGGIKATFVGTYYHPMSTGYINQLCKFIDDSNMVFYSGPNLEVSFIQMYYTNIRELHKLLNTISNGFTNFYNLFKNTQNFYYNIPKPASTENVDVTNIDSVIPIKNDCETDITILNQFKETFKISKNKLERDIMNNENNYALPPPIPPPRRQNQGTPNNNSSGQLTPSNNQSGSGKYVKIKKYGMRKVRYYKNGKPYVLINGKKKKI